MPIAWLISSRCRAPVSHRASAITAESWTTVQTRICRADPVGAVRAPRASKKTTISRTRVASEKTKGRLSTIFLSRNRPAGPEHFLIFRRSHSDLTSHSVGHAFAADDNCRKIVAPVAELTQIFAYDALSGFARLSVYIPARIMKCTNCAIICAKHGKGRNALPHILAGEIFSTCRADTWSRSIQSR